MEFDAKNFHILEMEKSTMRPSWTYKLGQNIITIVKEKKDLGMIIQVNLSPEKHLDRIFRDTFRMLENIRLVFDDSYCSLLQVFENEFVLLYCSYLMTIN